MFIPGHSSLTDNFRTKRAHFKDWLKNIEQLRAKIQILSIFFT